VLQGKQEEEEEEEDGCEC